MNIYKKLVGFKIIFLVGFIASVIIFIFGVNSDLYLGDETVHFRLAEYIYQNNSCPQFDPLVNLLIGKSYYNFPILWHVLLASIWKLTKGPSQIISQLYQTFYYLVLIIATFLIGRKMYEEKIALFSGLIIATVPMIVVLTMILHIDIPVAAVSTISFLMLINGKFCLSGVFLGLSFLFKRNSYLLIPAFSLISLFYTKASIKNNIKSFLFFIIPVILFGILDFLYAFYILGDLRFLYTFRWVIPGPPLDIAIKPLRPEYAYSCLIHNSEKLMESVRYIYYDPGNVFFKPLSLVTFLGMAILFGVVVYIYLKKFEKKDIFLWLPIVTYIPVFLIAFWGNLSVRYLVPIIPFLVLISAKGILSVKKKWMVYLIIGICIMQFLSSSIYCFYNRRIPTGIKLTYNWIKNQTPKNAHIISCRNALALYTNRVAFWWSYATLVELPYMFWSASETQMSEILNRYKIDFILIEKDRIYDDSRIRHMGGYPLSFIKKMKSMRLFENVIDNKDASLWKISYSKEKRDIN